MKKTQPRVPKTIRVNCGELCTTDICNSDTINLISEPFNGMNANTQISLCNFVHNPHSLSDRIIDLLQIAGYVFCADRMANRGDRKSVNNDSWARSFEFHIPVSDIDFWSRDDVKAKLSNALAFMTGDREYTLFFEKEHHNPLEHEIAQQSFFTKEYLSIEDAEKTDVMLFSGGLDSLAGAIERLHECPERKLCLVSHKSNNIVVSVQRKMVTYLQKQYGNSILQYGFECHNKKGAPSSEETQRTRVFLFTAIAFSICKCYEKKELYLYENGMTSLNFPKQADVFNARASRTTHPKTIGLLQEFFRLFDPRFNIVTPYYKKTKAEIMDIFSKYNEKNIISSSVSCSSSRNRPLMMSQCGKCSQCIDRIIAVYASELEDYEATYDSDIIHAFPDEETSQRVYNTLRLGLGESIRNPNDLMALFPTEMMDILEFWPASNPDDALFEVYELYCHFRESVLRAAKRIQLCHEDLTKIPNKSSILGILADRTYLETPFSLRIKEIDQILKKAIPLAFQNIQPKNENDFNDKVQSILRSHGTFSREYPIIRFGPTEYKADHGNGKLLIESKYIRGKTTPSVATRGISNDIVQISSDWGILFVVYDPDRNILDDEEYIQAFEQKRRLCFVRIYR